MVSLTSNYSMRVLPTNNSVNSEHLVILIFEIFVLFIFKILSADVRFVKLLILVSEINNSTIILRKFKFNAFNFVWEACNCLILNGIDTNYFI